MVPRGFGVGIFFRSRAQGRRRSYMHEGTFSARCGTMQKRISYCAAMKKNIRTYAIFLLALALALVIGAYVAVRVRSEPESDEVLAKRVVAECASVKNDDKRAL